MFSDRLFDHKYDIDDLIAALCRRPEQGKSWRLDSRTGVIGEGASTDAKYHHQLEPLPDVYIEELKSHPLLARLEPEARNDIHQLLQLIHHITDLPPLFDHGAAGGWIYERVKQEAVEWLDSRGLIPPSMRHVRDMSLFAPQKVTVKMEPPGDA